MLKRFVFRLFFLVFVGVAFTKCKEGCDNLPTSKHPLFRIGDTLIYTNDAGKKDTFQVTQFDYGPYYEGDERACIEKLHYEISKLNNTDTTIFDRIFVEEMHKFGHITMYLYKNTDYGMLLSGGYEEDSLYQHIVIGGKGYNSVVYNSVKNSHTQYRNLYYSYQYGLLSIEINNQLIYLSEVRPAR
jgi:hypothetical protein